MNMNLQLLAKKVKLPRSEQLDEQLGGGKAWGEEDGKSCESGLQ